MITTDITFPADNGRPMRAAYAAPSDSQKHPGVIVIHEIFGLNDDIRRITGMVADLGYAALAPDLYDRGGARLICIARTLLTLNRGEGDAFKDLDAARKFLQQQPGVAIRAPPSCRAPAVTAAGALAHGDRPPSSGVLYTLTLGSKRLHWSI